MAGLIPRHFIDDVLARSDIVELIDSRVKLKKAGKNYQACCPFHNEKTPSFTVSPDKQFYHCFGCGAHGNAISFLMEYDKLEFVEAVEELARGMGMEVPREKGSRPPMSDQQRQQRDNDYELMDKVRRFFQHQLKHHAQAGKAVAYLKQRGLSGEIVKHWEMGYAPDSWDAVLNAFGTTDERVQQLLELKLLTQNETGKRYDFFRNRIMFPIRDKRGRVVGFGGRVIDDGTPKYLNSPETRLFHKGQELYGFYNVKQQPRSDEPVLVVEGYMDVVALSQFGLHLATAALGTATTAEHMTMLSRHAKHIVFCYDGDRAGRDAAWRAMENALSVLKDGVQIRFLFLPDGEDPDTMVRQEGKEAFLARMRDAMPLSQFFFDNMLSQHPVNSTEGKAALKATAQPLIELIPGDNQRHLMQEALSKYTGEYDRYRLNHDIQTANKQQAKADQSGKFNQQKARVSPLRTMMRLLLDYPHLAAEVTDVDPALLVDSGVKGLPLLIEIHQYCQQHPDATLAHIMEFFRDHPSQTHLAKLLQSENLVSEDEAARVYKDSFLKLVDHMMDGRMEVLIAKSRVGALDSDEKQELSLLMQARKR